MFMNINHIFIQVNNDDDYSEKTTPDFTCSIGNDKYHLHTPAPAAHIIYHLGKSTLTGKGVAERGFWIYSYITN